MTVRYGFVHKPKVEELKTPTKKKEEEPEGSWMLVDGILTRIPDDKVVDFLLQEKEIEPVDLNRLLKGDLIKLAEAGGLSSEGTKKELIERIQENVDEADTDNDS